MKLISLVNLTVLCEMNYYEIIDLVILTVQ